MIYIWYIYIAYKYIYTVYIYDVYNYVHMYVTYEKVMVEWPICRPVVWQDETSKKNAFDLLAATLTRKIEQVPNYPLVI